MEARLRHSGNGHRRQYDKSERTKATILAAAQREFSTHGLAGARVDRIAKSARVNNHALYYHFGNKSALFRAVLENGYDAFRARQAPRDLKNSPPREAMAEIVSDVFEFIRDTPEHMALVLDVNRNRGAHLTADVRKRVRAAASPLLRDIGGVLRQGQSIGVFAKHVDPEHLYLTIFAVCNFYFTNAYTVSAVVGRDLLRAGAIRARKKHIVRFVLDALRP